MSVLNSTILERAWLSASNDYQQRIPNPSISSYSEHVAALFDPMNHDIFNQFSGLLNGIINTYVESKLFENPLRVLKKPADVRYGNSERRIAVKYLEAHSYMPSSETLLKVEKPEYVEWFYSVGTPRRYEFSWNKYELARAFAGDGYGFEDLLTATITQAYSSDNYDEMNIMLQMFAEAENRLGGIFKYQISAAPTTESTSKELLTAIRDIAGQMRFPTRRFNHIDVPVHTDGRDLVLFVTPSTLANIDVQALSAVFQLDKAEIKYRVIMVPEFPIPNVYAILASEDFIYCRDVFYGVEPPFYNPENLTLKYYLHHSQLIGVNPAALACAFTTGAATTIPTITETVTGIVFSPDTGNIEPGGTLQTYITLAGSLAASDSGPTGVIGVEPDAATYTLSAVDDQNAAFDLNSRTYVDSYGVLHCQKSIPVGSVITITAKATYINPSGSTSSYTDTFAATVV